MEIDEDTAADLLSAWIYKVNPIHFYLPGYPILLHSLADASHTPRDTWTFEKTKTNWCAWSSLPEHPSIIWEMPSRNFHQSDSKFIDMRNLMSPSYEPKIETADQVADYDGDYREP